jgi:hypothetical protein
MAAAEAGICRNAYVGQIGFLLLGSHPLAQAVVGRMATLADSAKRIRPYLDDDLRLCRWGILPVLAALLAGPPDLAETPSEFARCYTPRWTVHKNAGLAAYHRGDLHLYAPFAGGAVTRIYRGEGLILEDLGLHIRDGDKTFAVRDYDLSVSELPATAPVARRIDDTCLLEANAVADRPLPDQATHGGQPVRGVCSWCRSTLHA